MIAFVLVAHQLVWAQTASPEPPTTASVGPVVAVTDDDDVQSVPTAEELQTLAARDIGQARPTLRRAARTARDAPVRALALRLLAIHDASVATSRICARGLRLDDDPVVRRAGAECLGRLGPRLGAPQTPTLVVALDDAVLDVVTMAGWALANVGDAAAVGPLARLIAHDDPRVSKLFLGYVERITDRLGLEVDEPRTDQPAPDPDLPTAVPPGVVLTFPAASFDSAIATGWLGLYGAVAGWVHAPLFLSANGGIAGAEASPLAGIGLSVVGAAVMSGYGFARADSLNLAHTVVQLGTFGGLAGYGAGQLAAVGPASGITSANLSMAGTLAGVGVGMAFVEIGAPSPGALAAGAAVGAGVGVVAGSLASSYAYPFNQSLGVMLLTGSVAGTATTALLHRQQVGLFPLAGASVGAGLLGGSAALLATAIEPADRGPVTERTGWLVVSGTAAGAALGGALGWLLPQDNDPFLDGTLKLNPPTLAVIPGAGVRPEAATAVMVSGVF
jgi:hypothetical protein